MFFFIFPTLCRQKSPSGARTIPTHGFTQEAVHVLQAVDLNPPRFGSQGVLYGDWLNKGEQTHKIGHNMS